MKRSPVQDGIEAIDLDNWSDFYQLVASDFVSVPAYVFRGQANADWKVESSLDRWERLHSALDAASPPISRDVHLRAFRQAIRAISPVKLAKEDEALSWAMAQHHGLRTPLLDWSLSPFVALYFAFEDEFIPEGNQLIAPQDRAVLALSTSAIAEEQGDECATRRAAVPRVYSPSGPISQRLLAQSSLFLMMPEHTDLDTFITEQLVGSKTGDMKGPKAVLKRIRIPSQGRRECLKMLNKMNINRLTLFPDLDGAARYINGLWDLDFDSALGYFEDATNSAGERGSTA